MLNLVEALRANGCTRAAREVAIAAGGEERCRRANGSERSLRLGGFPQLDLAAFWIVDPREASVGFVLAFLVDANAFGA